MAEKLTGTDNEKLTQLCAKSYKAQAIWFLNAFWEENGEQIAERLWEYVIKCGELDIQKHGDGNGLDEMQAHVFLESFNETLTVRELRTSLRSTGAIGEKERPKLVPITHYLLFKYEADWHKLVNAAQGDNKEELAEAQRLLDECAAKFQESEARASEARVALNEAIAKENAAQAREDEAKAAEAEAVAREAEAKSAEADAIAKEEAARADEAEAVQREAAAKEAEAPFKAATDELEKALADVKAEEDAYNGKIDDCKRRAETGGVVQRNKAKNELAQLEGEDPLPLRRAKITLEAAKKKADKARAPFEAATAEAESARAAATASAQAASASRAEATAAAEQASEARAAAQAARQRSEEAAAAAAEALAQAEAAMKEAEDYLEEVKAKPGVAYGAIWWMERELHEQKKFMPESKGGIRRN
eukprot:TRINITY_DN75_c0_g2_i6.p1 TRINITY_DN75_c0_g2~~TRINITY_DN75_c0_g2_i6.p1  ORF type:complete len:420 (+),score=218.90 TRINITY_DN75_c0_g2_i6:132-1391(+)